jgi:hypothetical protein
MRLNSIYSESLVFFKTLKEKPGKPEKNFRLLFFSGALILTGLFYSSGCIHNDGLASKVDVKNNKGYNYSLKFIKEEKEEKVFADVLFSCLDPVGDDKGPGTYQYPLMDSFEKGAFDINYFSLARESEHYVFTIGIYGRINNSLIEKRFSSRDRLPLRKWNYQLFDIYIDTDGKFDSGETRSLPGRDILFDPAGAWEHVVIVSPRPSENVFSIMDQRGEIIALSDMYKKIIVPDNIDVRDSKFIIRIPIEKFNSPFSDNWSVQVLSMGYEEYDTEREFMNKRIRSFADSWGFGGGSDNYGGPNVMDILVSKNMDQFRILSNYSVNPDPSQARLAVVPLISMKGINDKK